MLVNLAETEVSTHHLFFPGDLPTSYGPSAAGRSQRQPFFYDQRRRQTSEWPSCDSIPLDSLRSPVNTLVRELNTVGLPGYHLLYHTRPEGSGIKSKF